MSIGSVPIPGVAARSCPPESAKCRNGIGGATCPAFFREAPGGGTKLATTIGFNVVTTAAQAALRK